MRRMHLIAGARKRTSRGIGARDAEISRRQASPLSNSFGPRIPFRRMASSNPRRANTSTNHADTEGVDRPSGQLVAAIQQDFGRNGEMAPRAEPN
jgi:hypothetical protein